MPGRRSWLTGLVALVFFGAAAVALLGRMASPPVAAGAEECINLPEAVCDQLVADIRAYADAAHGGLVGYRLLCVVPDCTIEEGEVRELVLYGDGTSDDGTQTWTAPAEAPPPDPPGGAVPEPTLPVVPVCRDVPLTWCEDLALQTIRDAVGAGERVESITVWCASTCTEAEGTLSIRINLANGREIVWDGNFMYGS